MLLKYKWFILLLITLVIIECLGIGYLGVWRESFWGSISDKNLHNFIVLLSQFTVIALILCLISGYQSYLINYISLLIRKDLTIKALQCNYYNIEGGEQRIQEDCMAYPQLALSLCIGLLRNTLIFVTFMIIISQSVGIKYAAIPILYTLIGTCVAHFIAKPLINLNYLKQVIEAKYRRYILNQYGVDIYEEVHDTNLLLFKATKKLNYFQSFFSQITVIIPHLILSPLYFSNKIVFGVFMQIASSIAHVIDALSYFVSSFDVINNYRSCKRRMKELGVID